MRVLLVNTQGADLAGGGSGRYVADLARGLAGRGHDVHVLAAFPVREDGAGSTTVLHRTHWREDRIRRVRNHLGDLVSMPGGRLEHAVAEAEPELVHTCNLTGFGGGVWELARRRGTPLVHTLLDYHLLCPRVSLTRRDGSPCCPHPAYCSFRTSRLTRFGGAVTDVVSGSEHLWSREGRLFPHPRPHIVRVPIIPVADRLLRPPDSPPRVLGYLGGLDPVKGIEPLLAAAPALTGLGLELRIAGDGRLRSRLEAATGPGLVYAGPLVGPAKTAFIEETDLALVPSTYEEPWGPPYAVAEWLAAGRPVLASTRGALAEARTLPGVHPIEPTAHGIAAAVRGLLDGTTWQDALSMLQPVEDAHDFERWLDAHEAVYDLAAERRASRSA